MTRNLNKILILTTTLLSLSGCYVNTKPDHPQIRESFSERRAPVNNELAREGLILANQKNEKFKGVRPERVGTALSQQEHSSASSPLGNTLRSVTGSSSSSGSSSSGSSSSSSSSGESFFSRLWKKLFSQNEFQAFNVAYARQLPIENYSELQVGQGSTENTFVNYYELAEDIAQNIPENTGANTIANIYNDSKDISNAKFGYMMDNGNIAKPIQQEGPRRKKLAAIKSAVADDDPVFILETEDNPSWQRELDEFHTEPQTPMREDKPVPLQEEPQKQNDQVPSVSELHDKADKLEAPKLSDVPKAPKAPKAPEAKKPTPKAKAKKAVSTKELYKNTKYRDPIKKVDPNKFEIIDTKAKIEIEDGKHIFRGTLGTIKK